MGVHIIQSWTGDNSNIFREWGWSRGAVRQGRTKGRRRGKESWTRKRVMLLERIKKRQLNNQRMTFKIAGT